MGLIPQPSAAVAPGRRRSTAIASIRVAGGRVDAQVGEVGAGQYLSDVGRR
jgi:hypothetical protein